MAERVGFEPTEPSLVHTISSRALSTELSHLSMLYIWFFYLYILTFWTQRSREIPQPSFLMELKNSFSTWLHSSASTPDLTFTWWFKPG